MEYWLSMYRHGPSKSNDGRLVGVTSTRRHDRSTESRGPSGWLNPSVLMSVRASNRYAKKLWPKASSGAITSAAARFSRDARPDADVSPLRYSPVRYTTPFVKAGVQSRLALADQSRHRKTSLRPLRALAPTSAKRSMRSVSERRTLAPPK